MPHTWVGAAVITTSRTDLHARPSPAAAPRSGRFASGTGDARADRRRCGEQRVGATPPRNHGLGGRRTAIPWPNVEVVPKASQSRSRKRAEAGLLISSKRSVATALGTQRYGARDRLCQAHAVRTSHTPGIAPHALAAVRRLGRRCQKYGASGYSRAWNGDCAGGSTGTILPD